MEFHLLVAYESKCVRYQPDYIAPLVGYLSSKGKSLDHGVRPCLSIAQTTRITAAYCLKFLEVGLLRLAGNALVDTASPQSRLTHRKMLLQSGRKLQPLVSPCSILAVIVLIPVTDDRATNPSTTSEAIQQVRLFPLYRLFLICLSRSLRTLRTSGSQRPNYSHCAEHLVYLMYKRDL